MPAPVPATTPSGSATSGAGAITAAGDRGFPRVGTQMRGKRSSSASAYQMCMLRICPYLQILLQREGWQADHKRVYRLSWRRSSRYDAIVGGSAARYAQSLPQAVTANPVWPVGFMSDKLSSGRRFLSGLKIGRQLTANDRASLSLGRLLKHDGLCQQLYWSIRKAGRDLSILNFGSRWKSERHRGLWASRKRMVVRSPHRGRDSHSALESCRGEFGPPVSQSKVPDRLHRWQNPSPLVCGKRSRKFAPGTVPERPVRNLGWQ